MRDKPRKPTRGAVIRLTGLGEAGPEDFTDCGDPEPGAPIKIRRMIHVAREMARLKIPFQHQGRSLAGVDCIGLIVCAAYAAGIRDLPDRRDYPRDPIGRELERALDDYAIRILHPELGAIALIRFIDRARHVALLTPHDMIHAWDQVGYCCCHHYGRWFETRTTKLYRLPGQES